MPVYRSGFRWTGKSVATCKEPSCKVPFNPELVLRRGFWGVRGLGLLYVTLLAACILDTM